MNSATSSERHIVALQQLVESELHDGVPSCILHVNDPVTGVVFNGAAGTVSFDDETAVQPLDTFRIASITKTFTSVVLMQLVTEGRVNLDDLMCEHIPEDLDDLVDRIHVFGGESYGRRITIRQLLRHSSGLIDYASQEQFFGEIAADPGKPWNPRRFLEGSIAWGSPHFAPDSGYMYAYSDTGYVLLGVIIEHVTGEPLHVAYRSRIIDPLSLAHTYLEGFEDHRGPQFTHPYEGPFDASPIHGTADWAGGGLVSTAQDLATFITALFNDELLAREALDEMLAYDFRTLDPAQHTEGYLGYGLGIDARRSGPLVLHGHRGHWGALMHIHPESGLVVTGTINQSSRFPNSLMHGVVSLLR